MLTTHEIAGLWPAMTADEYGDLLRSITDRGQLVPALTWRGQLVDGRQRARACAELGRPLRTEALPDDWGEVRVAEYVAAIHTRRDLSVSQRGVAAGRLALYCERFRAAALERQQAAGARGGEGAAFGALGGRPTERETPLAPRGAKGVSAPAPEPKPSKYEGLAPAPRPASGSAPNEGPGRKAAADAARVVGVSTRTAERGAEVVRRAPEVAARVDAGSLSLAQAVRVARMPAEQRAASLAQLDTGDRSQDASDSWGTPTSWIAFAREVMGRIDLDPASNADAQRTVQAARYYTREDDGLSRDWAGCVWLNPPYSQPLVTRFAEKLLAELDAGRVEQAIVLVNNATDTRFAQSLLGRCAAALFPAGRVSFVVPGGGELAGARQGQMVLYFGPLASAFLTAASVRGIALVRP